MSKHFEPGDCFDLKIDLTLSFLKPANVDLDELQVAIDLFVRTFVDEMYVEKEKL